jgi:hypothetical protein
MPENNIGGGGFTDIFTSIERYKMFNYGDRVLYIGKETHTLKGLTGTVTETVGRQKINLANIRLTGTVTETVGRQKINLANIRYHYYLPNIPVWWDSIGKHIGVFPSNIELIENPEPDWEL